MNPGHPKISVVIPCFNASKFIEECIQSVLNQSFNNFEIICVNDGSTDSTSEILQCLASKHPMITVLEIENKGAPHARNLGFKKSQGDYIQFLDADDILNSDKFQQQITLFRDDIDVVTCNYETWDINLESRISETDLSMISNNPLEASVTKVISTIGPLYKASFIQKFEWDESLIAAQDWEYNTKLILEGARLSHIDFVGFKIRRTTNSVSSDWIRVAKIQVDIVEHLASQLLGNSLFNANISCYIARLYYNCFVHDGLNYTAHKDNFDKWCISSRCLFSSRIKRVLAGFIGVRRIIWLDRLRNRV